MSKRRLVLMLALGAVLAGCSAGPHVRSTKPPRMGKPAPDFTLKDLDGRPVVLSDLRGKVVLLAYWAVG